MTDPTQDHRDAPEGAGATAYPQERPGPLSGTVVIDLTRALAGPHAGMMMADLGARVIKVENPKGGDFARHYDDVVLGPGGLAAHFVWCNRNKESVALELGQVRVRRRIRSRPC